MAPSQVPGTPGQAESTRDAGTVAADFFVVPTIRNQVLFVFLILAHDRRRVLHFNVTANPTAAWTAQQIVEAFPWQDPPKYLLRDRDGIYGQTFRRRVTGMGFQEVLIAPQSPWKNPYIERLIGSIRRDCLDHVIVIDERHLRRILSEYLRYYRRWRTHRALEMDYPEHRPVHAVDRGRVVEIPEGFVVRRIVYRVRASRRTAPSPQDQDAVV